MSSIKSPEVLTWVFFGSQGITDTDLMRCMMLCQDICGLENPNVEKIKNMGGYLSCVHDIPHYLISDGNLQKIIDWEL